MMKLESVGALFLLLVLVSIQSGASLRQQKTDQAYVTLLYGDEFLLGVRVLGKSIRDTRSDKDMVVLVSDGVSNYAMQLLQLYILMRIQLWLSIEDLFKCSKFCANLKHSERLNSGVMVVEPSQSLFSDMMSKVNTLHSYTGGDQGFLNSYYSEFPNAHVFEPSLPEDVRKSRPIPDMERLSTLYNADVGLYMLANKWMVNETQLHVIHYTLGPLKPWDWWTSWLLKPVDIWQNVREQLAETLPGTGGGRNPNDELIVKFLFLLPLITLLICYYRSFLRTLAFCRSSLFDHIRHLYYKIRSCGYAGVSLSLTFNSANHLPNGAQLTVPAHLGGFSIIICFISALVALAISLSIVLRQVMPWTGLVLMYEWTFTIFILCFGGFLHFTYLWGKRKASQLSDSAPSESSDYEFGKGHQWPGSSFDVITWYYGLGMAFLAVATPSLPCAFGITALFARLGLVVAGGIVLASFMTYASEHLAIRAFLKGFEHRDSTRARSTCV